MRPAPQDLAHRLREMAAIVRATTPGGKYKQTRLVPATYMEWAAEAIESLLSPAAPPATNRETEVGLWVAYIRSTAGILRGKDLPLMAAQHDDCANRLEALLDCLHDQCSGCCTPTCASCFHPCETCGKPFCQRCAHKMCPNHGDSEDQTAAVHEVLAAEGFEDVGPCPACVGVDDVFCCPVCGGGT